MDFKKRAIKKSVLRHWISFPIIYSMIIPIIILDVFTEIFHRTCFLLYGLPYVKRSNYIKIDRYKLQYLPFLEKVGCSFCGYTNGLLNYVTKIAGDTEKYWCGIKHSKGNGFVEPKHQKDFLEYNEEEVYKKL